MRKLLIVGLACGLVLTGCNGIFNNNDKDEPDTLERERADNGLMNTNTKHDAQQPVKPQRFLERGNTMIMYEGKKMSIETLTMQIDEKLEQENAGMDFYTNIDAEDDNTQ